MKKKLVLCMVLYCIGSIGNLNSQEPIQPKDWADVHTRVNIKGSLGTVYVDTSQRTFTFSVPAPRESVVGTSPASTWNVSNNTLTITVGKFAIGIESPGDYATMGVGVSDGGVYEITVIGI